MKLNSIKNVAALVSIKQALVVKAQQEEAQAKEALYQSFLKQPQGERMVDKLTGTAKLRVKKTSLFPQKIKLLSEEKRLEDMSYLVWVEQTVSEKRRIQRIVKDANTYEPVGCTWDLAKQGRKAIEEVRSECSYKKVMLETYWVCVPKLVEEQEDMPVEQQIEELKAQFIAAIWEGRVQKYANPVQWGQMVYGGKA